MTLTFGSICSGIEAASVAWHDLGWRPSWLAEVDPAASAVLAHRLGATAPQYPLPGSESKLKRFQWGNSITNWGDMTRIPDLVRIGAADAPDVLCGGTPCQSFSVAGARKGLADPRGQLTLSFVELADAIDERRAAEGKPPCIIFWENVPGVLSHDDNPFGNFLAALAGDDEALEPGPRPEHGRSSAFWTWKKASGVHSAKWPVAGAVAGPSRAVAWIGKDAQYFGLAQRRARVFVVASAREGFDPAAVLFEFDGLRRDSAPSRGAGQDIAGTLAARTDGGGFSETDEACSGYVLPVQRPGVMAHGQGGAEISEDRCPTRTCNHEAPIAAIPILEAGARTGVSTTDQRAGMGIGKDGDPMFTLQAGKQHGVAAGNHPPAIAFSCKIVGRNQGQENAVCVTGDITHTLTAEGFDASEAGTGRGQPIVPCNFQASQSGVRPNPVAGTLDANYGPRRHNGVLDATMSVRRLMPVECERLQGFPDQWTSVPVGKGFAADGPRYKQLGNSWAVPVVRWIGERIAAHIEELDARSTAPQSPFALVIASLLEVA